MTMSRRIVTEALFAAMALTGAAGTAAAQNQPAALLTRAEQLVQPFLDFDQENGQHRVAVSG